METIIFKAPDGTRAKLKRINPNVSALLREQVDKVIELSGSGSAHEKAGQMCGSLQGGPGNVSTSREYLKRYAPKSAH
jgi:hypothetical protein